jgi:GAF domain-containing protein
VPGGGLHAAPPSDLTPHPAPHSSSAIISPSATRRSSERRLLSEESVPFVRRRVKQRGAHSWQLVIRNASARLCTSPVRSVGSAVAKLVEAEGGVVMTVSSGAENDSNPLGLVSDFASKSHSQPEEALNALLTVAQKIVGYQTVLISQIDPEKSQLRIHAVLNTDPALTVPPGLQIPLTASPCQHVAGSIQPFKAYDMFADPDLAMLPACKDMGAKVYIGVPVVVADGSFFGTLVGLDTGSKEQSPEHVEWLQVLARLAALEIQRQDIKELVAT